MLNWIRRYYYHFQLSCPRYRGISNIISERIIDRFIAYGWHLLTASYFSSVPAETRTISIYQCLSDQDDATKCKLLVN